MFRSHGMSKLSNDLEQDENYQFSGATLKISSDNNPELSTVRDSEKYDDSGKSAILSGSDLSSPVLSTGLGLGYNEINSAESQSCDDAQPKPKTNAVSGSPGHFFSFRPGQFEKAIADCVNILLRPTNDTDVLGSWLLTEISHWDHDRERVIILTSKTLLSVKYDFIALRILQHFKVRLNQIDTILKGKLTYPQTSLVPRLEGITNGVTSIISGNLFCRNTSEQSTATSGPRGLALANRFDFSSFKPIVRNEFGIRVMWNKGQPLSLLRSWNPFAAEIPWTTIKDHPLYYFQDPHMSIPVREEFDRVRFKYSVESLYNALIGVFSVANPDGVDFNCVFEEKPIEMENYVGIGAVIHNKNNFGFFKVRGKFSF